MTACRPACWQGVCCAYDKVSEPGQARATSTSGWKGARPGPIEIEDDPLPRVRCSGRSHTGRPGAGGVRGQPAPGSASVGCGWRWTRKDLQSGQTASSNCCGGPGANIAVGEWVRRPAGVPAHLIGSSVSAGRGDPDRTRRTLLGETGHSNWPTGVVEVCREHQRPGDGAPDAGNELKPWKKKEWSIPRRRAQEPTRMLHGDAEMRVVLDLYQPE